MSIVSLPMDSEAKGATIFRNCSFSSRNFPVRRSRAEIDILCDIHATRYLNALISRSSPMNVDKLAAKLQAYVKLWPPTKLIAQKDDRVTFLASEARHLVARLRFSRESRKIILNGDRTVIEKLSIEIVIVVSLVLRQRVFTKLFRNTDP